MLATSALLLLFLPTVQDPAGNARIQREADFARALTIELGMEDLADEVKAGNMNFDVVIAAPDAMRIVGQLGRVLGPRGLMPNPKVGTVTSDVGLAVKNAKAGQAQFRADKSGIVHCSIGKASFSIDALKENLEAVLTEVRKSKPSSSKGVYMQSISLSTTMGPGVVIDKGSIAALS